ncbi:hypothetical protein B0T13DRAFT_447100 [Neurospora crassa]|nr:hypothetical protein B0T13DRAFT_447100 [Neurospora crassa]
MDHIWDKPGDVRGVIMYLPPKYGIQGSLHDQIKDMGDNVFGHPVVIQAIRGSVDTAPVDIFPYAAVQITGYGKKGPCKPGRPGVPKYKDCLPTPLDPELRRQDTDLSLDLAVAEVLARREKHFDEP